MGVDIRLIGELLLAALCGAALGLEREINRKPAGLRTNMLIALGSALFTYCSITLAGAMNGKSGDPGRIAAQIVTGIGFLGAGTIMRHKDQVTGLTSAATVWVVAAIGVLAGAGRSLMAICATLIALIILHALVRVEGFINMRVVNCAARVLAEDREGILTDLEGFFRSRHIQVHELKRIPSEAAGRVEVQVHYFTTRKSHARIHDKLAAIPGVQQVETRIL